MHASLNRRLKEGAFLLLLAIGAYFMMALFSYSPDDPSWVLRECHTSMPTTPAGVAGAWAASVLFMLFGKVAYVFPLMIAWGGWLMFRERDEEHHSVNLRIARWVGFVLIVLTATSLAALHFGAADELPEGAGGITWQHDRQLGQGGVEFGRCQPAAAHPVAGGFHPVYRRVLARRDGRPGWFRSRMPGVRASCFSALWRKSARPAG